MRNRLLWLAVPTILALAGCGSSATPAAVTSTVVTTAPASTVTAMSTVMVSAASSAPAAAGTGKQSANQAMCSYADTILNYVDAQTATYPKDSLVSASTVLGKIAQDSSDSLTNFQIKYLLNAGLTDDIITAVTGYLFGVTYIKQNPGSSTVADLDATVANVRKACKAFI